MSKAAIAHWRNQNWKYQPAASHDADVMPFRERMQERLRKAQAANKRAQPVTKTEQ